MAITVMKFGGTSMDRLDVVTELIERERKNNQPIAVVSAFSGITDQLLAVGQKYLFYAHKYEDKELFNAVIDETIVRVEQYLKTSDKTSAQKLRVLQKVRDFCSAYVEKVQKELKDFRVLKREQDSNIQEINTFISDRICGLGEVFSSFVLTTILNTISDEKRLYNHVDLAQIISFDSRRKHEYLAAKEVLYDKVQREIRKKIHDLINAKISPVLSGYIGYIPGGILQTIDRGYTDSTAAMTAVSARSFLPDVRLQIWKEVPGLMSADPKLVENNYDPKKHTRASHFKGARLRREVSFIEAAELSDLGGMKAINPNGIHVLEGKDIALEVRNTFDPDDQGTKIVENVDKSMRGVRFISGKKNQIIYKVSSTKMVNQKGVAARIFRYCTELDISVDAITTSATVVAFSIDGRVKQKKILEEGLGHIGKLTVYENRALICCIGNGFEKEIGLLSRLAGILSTAGINIDFDCGDADNNITFIIDEKDFDKAIKALHKEFFSGNVQNSGG